MRVWYYRETEEERGFKTFPVSSIKEAAALINTLAKKDLSDDFVICNCMGLEVYNDEWGEWEEWCDEDFNEIDYYLDY